MPDPPRETERWAAWLRQGDRHADVAALAAHRPGAAQRVFDEGEPVGRPARANLRAQVVDLAVAPLLGVEDG